MASVGNRTVDDRIDDPWGERTPYGSGEDWPPRTDAHFAEGVAEHDVERWVQSASILHSNGDAMDIAVKDGKIVGVRGREGDRVNRGRLGPKDLFGWQGNASPDRLTRPLLREGPRLVETDWDTAMGRIVERSQQLLDGPGGWGRFGFYTSGQLFLEEYYTLAVIGKAGIGTPHMDGNTRLCTATSAAALKASFGTDGQPGSYTDIDHCDAWPCGAQRRRDPDGALDAHARPASRAQPAPDARRRPPLHGRHPRGRHPPSDPHRHQPSPDERTHPRAPRPTTGGTLRTSRPTPSASRSCRRPSTDYDVERVADICDIPGRSIAGAAELLGTCERLLSTVLQGFYQSNQATAAACQVNNIHLLRGMLGRPERGVLQMNGQPTAQNTRETGADGDLPGIRNWSNEAHVAELARLWNVDLHTIPHWAAPTHAMQIFRYAEQGSIELLWISATNPAVSLPELDRVRSILARPGAVRRRPGHLPHGDRGVRRRRAARSHLGREDSAPSPTPTAPSTSPTRRSTRPARPERTSTSSSTTPAAWTSGTATASR